MNAYAIPPLLAAVAFLEKRIASQKAVFLVVFVDGRLADVVGDSV